MAHRFAVVFSDQDVALLHHMSISGKLGNNIERVIANIVRVYLTYEFHGNSLGDTMVSPVGVLPAALLAPEMKAEAIRWLNSNVPLKELRRYYLIGWSQVADVELKAADYQAIGFGALEITGE